ncbi:prolipoprotein diacylglyceryl transferase [uncultured Desulfobacter sp.]|jgi:phosphatidylglycerol:prolipoprotein diacylglycerol transferase|uniref:prolipoprotein diacylglyceryl transferase n=1 Tax=uncultured Desulfobacter sp. TaxID=240139 RepID=UPI0029C612FA|nr:prolipoprotein diacylglyceryl transferase [uncultured Desulfobacter sp.]
MHPILLQVGSLKLYTYGFFVALGFIIAIWFTKRNARFYGVPDQMVSDLFLTVLISALAGARILYVLINIDAYRDNFLDIFKIWNGGLVFFGGFIGGALGAIIFLRIKKMDIWKTADVISPGLALGHSVGRFGCLFAGCCYGKSCSLPIAITFTNPDSLAPLNIPLHPTQLYMIASNFVLFLILLAIQRRKRFNGMVFLSYIMLYSVFRSIIEFFRGDFRGNFFFDFLSLSQGIGLLVSCIALIFMIIKLRSRHGSH